MKYDGIAKDLFQKDRPALLDEFTEGVAVREFLNVEFPALLERRADLVLLLADGRILHIEFQSDNDRDMPYRQGMYGLMIGQRYRSKVSQVVLYLGPEPLRMEDRVDVGCVQASYRLIDIRQFDAEDLLASGRPGDMALAMLARGGAEKLHEILERARTLAAPERGRLVMQLAVLSGLRGLSNQLKMELKAMGSGYVDIESNPILQDWMAEAGERARKKEAAKMLRLFMHGKFGPLPEWVDQRISNATADEMELWAERLLTVSTIEAVFE